MESEIKESFNLADLFFGAAKLPTHVSLIETDEDTGHTEEFAIKDWAGGVNEASEGHIWGPKKAEDLLKFGSVGGLTTTPVPEVIDACQYRGGIRYGNQIVAVSGFDNDKIDLMFAALLRMSLNWEFRLHHIGFRYADEAKRRSEMHNALCGLVPITLPAPGHTRYFVRKETKRSKNKMFWLEYQKWNEPQEMDGVHIDIAMFDPEGVAQEIGKLTGLEVTPFGRSRNSPSVKIHGIENGTEIALMLRPDWSDPKNW